MKTVVVGVGNELRGDDAVGLHVVRALGGLEATVVECEGEPIGLIDSWAGHERAILVDATESGAEPGTVRRVPADEGPLPPELQRSSTHLLGVAEAVELARALGRLPAHTIVYGIEGGRFDTGAPLSPEVEEMVEVVAAAIRREVEDGGPR
ncbi:MAG TPA: hydrogenase maturation protease [Gaiellaceae bacterium]|nr:hydrogenase maturation protease [Gaiellaceae bacterium]